MNTDRPATFSRELLALVATFLQRIKRALFWPGQLQKQAAEGTLTFHPKAVGATGKELDAGTLRTRIPVATLMIQITDFAKHFAV